LNAYHESVPFTLPAHKKGVAWEWIFDTAITDDKDTPKTWRGGKVYELEGRAMALMRLR
jgi:glycogen operon protein